MNEDTRESIEGSLCMGLAVLLAVLFLGLSGCDQIAAGGINPAVAAEVAVEAERLKLESDNQPVLPDDFGGAKEESAPVASVPNVIAYTPDFACPWCDQMKRDADILPVRVEFRDAPKWVNDWVAQAPNVRGYPVLHYYAQGNWKLLCGYQGKDKFAAWCGKPLLPPKTNAPEVATQRPFAESWRQELSRKHGRRASAAHTDLDAETVALPTTQINLRSQCVEFSGASRDSRLNRWFSVSFGPGSVSHSGSTVNFSNPPELRFHLFEGGKGEMLDSLRAIEFVSGGAKLHLTRLGSINFKVKL